MQMNNLYELDKFKKTLPIYIYIYKIIVFFKVVDVELCN